MREGIVKLVGAVYELKTGTRAVPGVSSIRL